jgi:prolyl-tRNA synthetase
MRYSQLFGKTSKTVNKDALVASHRFLLQGAFIRQLSAGRYSLLPLGMRVYRNIKKIIRREIKKIGTQEVLVPSLHPIELWQQANRDKKFGAAMMRVTDRNQNEFTLGATAEVVMLDLVKQFNVSYKDLPINIFQFSQKFRDEARPSGGLLRTREFTMKDGYSFHVDEADLKITYQKYWDAYLKICQSLDLQPIIVESDNGAIGGSVSHEFMIPSEVGEDTIVLCDCGYAANLEKATFVKKDHNPDESPKPLTPVHAPRGNTMEDGVKFHKLPLWRQIKDVVYVDDRGNFILAIICGDYMVNETKLKNVLATNELRPATDEEIRFKLHSEPGFISPVGLKGAKIIADDSLKNLVNAYGAANKKDTDYLNINIGRDYQPDLIVDIAQAQDSFICPQCHHKKLALTKAIEFGNIFNIGFVYSQPMKGTFVASDGSLKNLYMGSYGIGLERAMAIVVETHHDKHGIIWPKSITPFQIHLIGLDNLGEDLYQKLIKKHYSVLFDDRHHATAGEKFADADLIGIPVRLLVSKRSQEKGGIEYKLRSESDSEIVTESQLFDKLQSFYI